MKEKWYQSNIAKAILIIVEHILIAAAVVSFVWLVSYPALLEEMFAGNQAKEYQDSVAFEQQMRHYSSQVLQGANGKMTMETDGQYDPEKIVDLKYYYDTLQISGKDMNGLSYRLGDLITWYTEYSHDSGEYPNDTVIVCKKTDGTYQYYTYPEFEKMIISGELNVLRSEPEYAMTAAEGLQELLDMGEFGSDFAGIHDKNGKTLYIDCWVFDGAMVTEHFTPVGTESILDIMNTNPEWNGKLSEAYDMLYTVVQNLGEKYDAYLNMDSSIKEGDSNYFYIYADTQNGVIYTNNSQFADYNNLEKSLESLKKLGKYVVVKPLLKDFESNIEKIDAELWRDEVKYGGGYEDDFIFAAAVDTSYPIQDTFYSENEIYEAYGFSAGKVMAAGSVALILALAVLIWLTIIAGRNSVDEELHLNCFDGWKTEIAGGLVFGVWLVVMLFYSFIFVDDWLMSIGTFTVMSETIPYMVCGAIGAIFTCGMFLTGYLSLVRRIKAGTVWSNSLLRMFIGFVKNIFENLHCVWKTILLFGIFAVIHWIAILTWDSFFFFAAMLAAEATAFILLIYSAIGRERLKKGISKIADGEIDYKIPTEGMMKDQKIIAENVNDIGAGLELALEKSMKSERLKTDLITNVSHDIKTPLTSIINYVNLLEQENFEDPKIQHYLEVLNAKAQRLKTLTEDVVEASKVSSGNINLEFMNLNFAEILQQTSGEFEEKFAARGLKEVLTLPKEEAIIWADGRRIWRILENIYNNAAKYAMEGTRVYADLQVKDGRVIFSLKNISEQPLNISADELTERFIRGDISRSTEGSGLGLSIAKNLTEMQSGTFEVYLDGDLFKVTISFLKTR